MKINEGGTIKDVDGGQQDLVLSWQRRIFEYLFVNKNNIVDGEIPILRRILKKSIFNEWFTIVI